MPNSDSSESDYDMSSNNEECINDFETDSGSDIIIPSKRLRIISDSSDDYEVTASASDGDNIDEFLPVNTIFSNESNSFFEVPGPKHAPASDAKPIEYFNKFFSNSLFATMADNNEQRPCSVEVVISLKKDQPVIFRPRRLAFTDKEKLRTILDDLLREGVIKPSNSPYASPIVLTRKKNGEIRLCIDYREINKNTIRDNFPVPLIDDYLDQLRDKQYFTKLDLKNGFHHVKVAELSIKYTSFITPLGQYEYLKMPFGLTNAPRIFQRFLNEIFGKLVRQNKLLLYLDDFLVATQTTNEHLKILDEVFQLARKHDLQFRLDKCSFLFRQITYLGYSITDNGISPTKENIESVADYPIPRNTKEVQRFIGLTSYFRRFIRNFSTIARPLYDFLRNNSVFHFGQEENQSFVTLKKCLTNDPVLAIHSPNLETELHCDASSSDFGAILLQKQPSKIFQPVFYFSKRTTAQEGKYHSFELECLAIVYAIKRSHIYLLAKLAETPGKWDHVVGSVEYALNNTVCRSMGKCPSELLFGMNQNGTMSDNLRTALNAHYDDVRDLPAARQVAAEEITKCQLANQRAYNKKHKRPTAYQVGDYVVIRNTDTTPGVNKKLIPKFKGPYTIKKILDRGRYIVTDVEGFQLTRIPFTGVVGPDQMKHWIRSNTERGGDDT
ncbi:Retrovirus-related Pol polyprotein from transposon 17.6 [Anthophora retusa]